jgi:hypothetical protein
MNPRINLGVELVSGEQGYSFRMLKIRAGSNRPEIVRSMNCPLWFRSKAAAEGCAKDLIRYVMTRLQMSGFKVEKFEN